jgi:hypothetical protein
MTAVRVLIHDRTLYLGKSVLVFTEEELGGFRSSYSLCGEEKHV